MTRLKRHLFSLLRLAIAVAMLGYLASTGSIDWSALGGLANTWQLPVLAITLFFFATMIQAFRLQLLINSHQLGLSYLAAFKLTFIGLFFSTYLPGATGGDLIKIYYASKGNPGSRAEVITILLLDRFIGLLSLLSLPLLLAPFFLDLIASHTSLQALLGLSLVISLGIMIVTFIGARYDLHNSRLLGWLNRQGKLGSLMIRMLHTVHHYRHNMTLLLRALLLSYALQALMIGVSLAIAEAIIPTGIDLKMLLLIPIGYLANSLPLTPGGLGVGEAAMASLFTLGSLSGGAEMLIGWRLVMILVGLLGLVCYLKGEKQFVFSEEGSKQTTGTNGQP